MQLPTPTWARYDQAVRHLLLRAGRDIDERLGRIAATGLRSSPGGERSSLRSRTNTGAVTLNLLVSEC